MKFCTKCGAQNEDGLAFCSSCGNPLNGQVAGGVEKKPFNVLALIGMISGIIAVIWCWMSFLSIVGVIFGIAGVIMSGIARKNDPKNGMAIAGLICSIIAIVAGAIIFISCIACYGCAICNGGYYDYYYY